MTTREAIKTLRKLLGNWSQEQLAHEIGVRMQTISRWEREDYPLSLNGLVRLRGIAERTDQRVLAFIEEEIAAFMERQEARICGGVSTRGARNRWIDIAERNWRMTKALKAIEWMPILEGHSPMCPLCDQTQESGHDPHCLIGMALTYNEEKPSNGHD